MPTPARGAAARLHYRATMRSHFVQDGCVDYAEFRRFVCLLPGEPPLHAGPPFPCCLRGRKTDKQKEYALCVD